jgi:hypothetical protein
MALRDPRDRRRDRGREQGGLPVLRRGLEDGVEVLGKAHVEHLVRLVEDDDGDGLEVEALAGQVVDGPPGRRDDDVDAAAERPQLLPDRLAAVDGQNARPERLSVAVDGLGDLHGQLAGGHEDERAGHAIGGSLSGQPLDRREGEGGRLAGPGRRLGKEVAALEQRRDRLALDRRRLLVAEPGEPGDELAPQAEGAETVAIRGGVPQWRNEVEVGRGRIGHRAPGVRVRSRVVRADRCQRMMPR